jgi:hypothetical protein
VEQLTNPPQVPRSSGETATLVREVRDQLVALAASPVRLREISSRMQTLDEIDMQFEFTEEERTGLSGPVLGTYIEALDRLFDEKRRIREAYSSKTVIDDAWSEARAVVREMFPGRPFSEKELLVVLRGEPDWDVTEVLLPLMTVAPLVGPASRRRWRYSLLRCPEWFYWLLQGKVDGVKFTDGVPVLGDPVTLVDDQDAEMITALWEETPSSVYFDLAEAASAARSLA